MAKAPTLRALSDPVERQIDRRYQVQQLMFDLYKFLRMYTEFPGAPDDFWYQMNRMVGIAFSLWRSAFLMDVNSARKEIYDDTLEFIDKVLKHNAISFADDHRLCELTVGYYNSNARYRIERQCVYDEDLLQLPSIQKVQQLKKGKTIAQYTEGDIWDMCFLALKDCYAKFMRDWNRRARPQYAKGKRKRRSTPEPTA
jgi:hypothetical protein